MYMLKPTSQYDVIESDKILMLVYPLSSMIQLETL